MDEKQRFFWGEYYPKVKEKPFAVCAYVSLGAFFLFLCLALVTPYENFAHAMFIWLTDLALIVFALLGIWVVIEKQKRNREKKR
ncbi:MAG TPA: hypothetical protein VFV38_14140 [Ktedonobacteraceae bacterium]|nr:hypothetical protein [Ktedonobacteraceae bacterium]